MSSSKDKAKENLRRENDGGIMKEHDDEATPPQKKAKKTATSAPSSPTTKQQSTLHQFFSKSRRPVAAENRKSIVNATALSSPAKSSKEPKEKSKRETARNASSSSSASTRDSNNKVATNTKDEPTTATKTTTSSKSCTATASASNDGDDGSVPEPMIPQQVSPDPKARWKVVENCMMVRSTKEEPRTKAACFDVDGTLLVWRIPGWPSKLEHYELWNTDLISKLQALHDDGGYKLVFFSNQGAIRGAFTGKKATHVKSVMEWLAHIVQREVHIVMSTNKKLGYHKPSPGMWKICEKHCNSGVRFNVKESFFVGDSVGDEDPQGGVDEKFARNIGVPFHTPEDYFGHSDSERRKRQGLMGDYEELPAKAIDARKALLSGYLKGPILLLLCGVQGSGKSTFCKQLLAAHDVFGDVADSDFETDAHQNNDRPWVHLSQDTINKGKPGKREAVEEKTREVIQNGRSVIIDRTHLDPGQRKHFVDIAKELKVPVHVLVFQPSKDVISKRVRERTNHPAGVEGEKGVGLALNGLSKMVLPNYQDEGFDLISCVKREDGVKRLSGLYRHVVHAKWRNSSAAVALEQSCLLSCGTSMPNLALGTMKIGKRIASEVVSRALSLGWRALDTAPTYNNEEVVAEGLCATENGAFVIVKVPKRATTSDQVLAELATSLEKLKVRKADLLLLHWPFDVISTGNLKSVWQAMEKTVTDGKCRALGVCNFSVDALRQLLPHCTIPPSVNQVERHPLLPQMDLLDFCLKHDIVLQAHTPLGQSSLLSHETIVQVAKQANLTPAQVLLKWNLRHGVPVVCKCSSEGHQKDVIAIFDTKTPALGAKDMKVLDDIKEKKRFVAPPFMLAPGNVYTWKD